MKRIIILAVFAAFLVGGCEDKKKDSDPSTTPTTPSASEMFDKSSLPKGEKAEPGKFD